MAGNEKKGIKNSQTNLLDNATVFITPFKQNLKEKNLINLINFWKFIDTKPKIISIKRHDYFTGFTSHFSHIVAALETNLIFNETKKILILFLQYPVLLIV